MLIHRGAKPAFANCVSIMRTALHITSSSLRPSGYLRTRFERRTQSSYVVRFKSSAKAVASSRGRSSGIVIVSMLRRLRLLSLEADAGAMQRGGRLGEVDVVDRVPQRHVHCSPIDNRVSLGEVVHRVVQHRVDIADDEAVDRFQMRGSPLDVDQVSVAYDAVRWNGGEGSHHVDVSPFKFGEMNAIRVYPVGSH